MKAVLVAVLSPLVLVGCPSSGGEAIASVETPLSADSCRREPDKNDPNETPYLVCPGVAGYTLIVRRVDAGRESIDVVDSAQRAQPLSYQEVVTRHMFTLGRTAEWRVATQDGKQTPIALIVRVQAREANDDPEKVTATYLAVAKITPQETCVTDRLREDTPPADVHRAADAARDRPCAPLQPPMTEGGAIVR